MKASFQIRSILVAIIFCALAAPLFAASGDTQYSPTNPPPASFVYAGPVGGEVTASGEATVQFRFAAIIHSLKPTKIQVVDTQSGEVLVDDEQPKLEKTPYKHPSDPSIAIFQWVAYTKPEVITDTAPAWLHSPGDTSTVLEIRVFTHNAPVFTFQQPATCSASAKAAFLSVIDLNKSNAAAKP